MEFINPSDGVPPPCGRTTSGNSSKLLLHSSFRLKGCDYYTGDAIFVHVIGKDLPCVGYIQRIIQRVSCNQLRLGPVEVRIRWLYRVDEVTAAFPCLPPSSPTHKQAHKQRQARTEDQDAGPRASSGRGKAKAGVSLDSRKGRQGGNSVLPYSAVEIEDPRVLLYSFHEDLLACEHIMHKCTVHVLPPSCSLPDECGTAGFVARHVVDFEEQMFFPVTDTDYTDAKQRDLQQLLLSSMHVWQPADVAGADIAGRDESGRGRAPVYRTVRGDGDRQSRGEGEGEEWAGSASAPAAARGGATGVGATVDDSGAASAGARGPAADGATASTGMQAGAAAAMDLSGFDAEGDGVREESDEVIAMRLLSRLHGLTGLFERNRPRILLLSALLKHKPAHAQDNSWWGAAARACMELEEVVHAACAAMPGRAYNTRLRNLKNDFERYEQLAERFISGELSPHEVSQMSAADRKAGQTRAEQERRGVRPSAPQAEPERHCHLTCSACQQSGPELGAVVDIIRSFKKGDNYLVKCRNCGHEELKTTDDINLL